MANHDETILSSSTKEDRFFRTLVRKALANGIRRVVCSQPGAPPPDARIVPCLRCTFILQGVHRLWTDLGEGSELVSMRPGDVLLMRTGTWRLPRLGEARKILVVNISPYSIRYSRFEYPKSLEESAIRGRHYAINGSIAGPAAFLLKSIVEFTKQRPFPASCHPLIACLIEQCLEMMDRPERIPSKPQMTYHDLCHYVQDNFRRPISRESAGAAVNIHPAHVSRLFRSCGKTTFQEHVQRVRIEYAAQLLSETPLSIKEIAASSGFQETDYFRKVFHKILGATPQAYRADSKQSRYAR